jgi:glycosyltransferase involved in cell wall biosynthesis
MAAQVSVILPAYNEAENIVALDLASARNQSGCPPGPLLV